MSFVKKVLGKKGERNILNEILYSRLVGNTPIVFYDFNREDYISKGYSGSSEIYAIIRKITDKLQVATPYLYIDDSQVKSKKYTYTIKEIAKNRLLKKKSLDFADEETDLAKLLKAPNDDETWREFISLIRTFYFVQGEMFIYREMGDDECAISLHVAPSQHMTPVYGDNHKSIIKGWRLRIDTDYTRYLPAEHVLHMKMSNPNFNLQGSQLRGMSPLMSGLKYLQLDDNSLEAWLKTMANEGAKGIISPNHADPKLWLTPPQVKETEAMVDEKIHGYKNKNKIVVSNMPLQYTHIGLSPDAMNIVKALEFAGHKLCTLWGLSPVLFEPDPTYQNQKEASKRFVLEVVLPYLNAEEDKLNAWLVEPFRRRDGKNYVIDYDISVYEELMLSPEDIDALLKIYTINELRVMTGGDEHPNPYADEIFVSQGMVPLSDYDFSLNAE
jgi:HK97 family phage portal protein